MLRILYAGFTLLLLLSSCQSTKSLEQSAVNGMRHWVSIQKFPCFGHCQVYKISAYRNGLVILEGKEYMDKTGVFFTELSADKIKKLSRIEKKLNLNSIKEEYMVHIADLPITDIALYDENGALVKEVKANSNLPDALHDWMKEFTELIKTEKWTQIQHKNDMNNPEVIYNELVVDMDTTIQMEMLETEFAAFDLVRDKKLSPLMNLWNIKFNTDKIGKYEMLVTLRQKPGIRHVSFNRRILPRE